MFSSKALASLSHIFSIRSLVALCLVLTPQLVSAQAGGGGTGSSEEEPPPIWYRPGPVTDDAPAVDTFICRTTATDGSGNLYCAGEIGLGALTPVDVASDEPSLYTFALETHETISLQSSGAFDVRGELLDAAGVRLATNDNGGDARNFRITRTLGPGRYYVKVTGAGAQGRTTLSIERSTPRGLRRHVPLTELAGDVGNHCGRAAAVDASSNTVNAFDRPGDIDVFAIELAEARQLLIDVEGEARYELKAADCTTSLGLAGARLGATLAELAEGTYFLYVSQTNPSAGKYELDLELR